MLGELPGTTLTIEGESGEKSGRTARTMSMGTIIVDERQPVQTSDGLVLGRAVPPFLSIPNSKDISDSRGKGDIVCQQASSHGYNTRSKVKKPDMVQGINVNVVPNTPKSNPKVMSSQGQAKTKVKPVQGQTKTKKVE